ncbi:MAG: nicotinate (nicotinamide) nucleotide adenylyltransferase [Anaeroplasmataceae bacterium]
MNICYGGSFNPPTLAHKKIVELLEDYFHPENIIIIPCGNSYNRKNLLEFKYRYDMLKLMLDKVIISDIEAGMDKYKGTLFTLNSLSKDYDDLYFVMGADNLITIKTWINYEELVKKYHFIIFKRDDIDVIGFIDNNLKEYKDKFIIVDFDFNISSTIIRDDLASNKDMLDPKVFDYIIKNNLYKE